MDPFSLWTLLADWLGAGGTVAGVAVATTGVIVAGTQGVKALEQTRDNAKAAQDESARQDEERTRLEDERTRPYVVMRFDASVREGRLYLEVRNTGASAAYNVHAEITGKQLSDAEPGDLRDYGSYVRKFLSAPGVTLGPGDKVRTIYRPAKYAEDPDETLAPDKLIGTVFYSRGPVEAESGEVTYARTYREPFSIDLAPLSYLVDVSRSDRDVEQRLKLIRESIEKLAPGMAKAFAEQFDLGNDDSTPEERHRALVEFIREVNGSSDSD